MFFAQRSEEVLHKLLREKEASAPAYIEHEFHTSQMKTTDGLMTTCIIYVYEGQVMSMPEHERIVLGEYVKEMQRMSWDHGIPGGRSGKPGNPPRKVNT